MAVIKCKMCGGDLVLKPDSTVCECEYCGTKQTVPVADNEKKLSLFARANKLRAACEFDKAFGVFETIVAEFPEEAEAYWGLVLCKYGIEYVTDPSSGKKTPTCHRSSFDSLMTDPNLELTLENADAMARRIYREEAKFIEELRKNIVEVSSREEPYDVFICYKETGLDGQRTEDSVLAQDIYKELTREGYRVFFSRITLEDKLGVEYEPYIFAALNSAKVMLVVGTDYEYFNAVWVKNEWSRFLKLMAADHSKHLIPCYKDIDAYDMPQEFSKLQAQNMGKIGAMQDLLRGVEKLLTKKQDKTQQVTNNPVAEMLASAQTYIQLGDYAVAQRKYQEITDKHPQLYQGWWGRVICVTRGLTDNTANLQELHKWMCNAKKTAKPGEYAPLEKQYLSYLERITPVAASAEEQAMRKTLQERQSNLQKLGNQMQQLYFDEQRRKEYLAQDLASRKGQYQLGKRYAAKATRQNILGIIKIIIGLLLIGTAVYGLIKSGSTISNLFIAGVLVMLGLACLKSGDNNRSVAKQLGGTGQEMMAVSQEAEAKALEDDEWQSRRYSEAATRNQQETAKTQQKIQCAQLYLQLDSKIRKERLYAKNCQAIGVDRALDPDVQKLYEAAR